MALQIRKLNFPISAKSLEAVVAWNPCQCGNRAVNSPVAQSKNRVSHTAARFSPGFVTIWCSAASETPFWSSREFWSSQVWLQYPALLCLFSFVPFYSESRKHLALCCVSALWRSVRRGKLLAGQPGHLLGRRFSLCSRQAPELNTALRAGGFAQPLQGQSCSQLPTPPRAGSSRFVLLIASALSCWLGRLAQQTTALRGVFEADFNINLTLKINGCLSKPSVCWSDYTGCTQQLLAEPLPKVGDEAAVPLWESIVYYPVGAI